jgi:hypothetical protein
MRLPWELRQRIRGSTLAENHPLQGSRTEAAGILGFDCAAFAAKPSQYDRTSQCAVHCR